MKKKRIAIIAAALVIVAAGLFIYKKIQIHIHADENGRSVSIIGGADGPTSIFIAGKLGGKIEYTAITMEEAKAEFELAEGHMIVDVRRADEYAQGHIPGAINIANEDIQDSEIPELPDKDQLIYVYCRSGRRSREAAVKLVALGYTNIVECGGILDWTGEVE